MGTENIVFLDLVVVSRRAIIPEISLRYYALITWEHVFNLKKKKTCIIKKCGTSLGKPVSVNLSHLLPVSVKEGSMFPTMKHQRIVTLLHTVNH